MQVFRLCKAVYAPGLDGEGARIAPGRWNPRGVPVVYCAASASLAVLETFVHMPPQMRRAAAFPPSVLVTVTLDPDAVERLDPDPSLNLTARRALGGDWLGSGRSAALSVPSHVMPMERCVLLNPAHPDLRSVIRDVSETPFVYDPRMGG